MTEYNRACRDCGATFDQLPCKCDDKKQKEKEDKLKTIDGLNEEIQRLTKLKQKLVKEKKMELKFTECDACKGKPGSPLLCRGCVQNRAVISYLIEKSGITKFTPPTGCTSKDLVCFDYQCPIHGR
jgi:hypothetical protein